MELKKSTHTDPDNKIIDSIVTMVILLNDGKREWHHIMTEVGKIGTNLDSLKSNHEILTNRVLQLEDWSRKPFPPSTVKTYLAVIEKYFNGTCPCCGESKVLTPAGGKTPDMEVDHFKGPKWNKLHDGWPICQGCHFNLTHGYGCIVSQVFIR